MENAETAKLKAEGKLKLSVAVLLLLIAAGLVGEYQRANAPLAKITLILSSGADGASASAGGSQLVDLKSPTTGSEDGDAMDLTSTAASREDGASGEQQVATPVVAEFFATLSEINQQVNALQKSESVLDKIVVAPSVAPTEQPEADMSAVDETADSVELAEDDEVAMEVLAPEQPVETPVAETAEIPVVETTVPVVESVVAQKESAADVSVESNTPDEVEGGSVSDEGEERSGASDDGEGEGVIDLMKDIISQ